MIGTGATDLVHIGQAVMGGASTIDFLVTAVFNYPTFAESYKVAALDAANRIGVGRSAPGLLGAAGLLVRLARRRGGLLDVGRGRLRASSVSCRWPRLRDVVGQAWVRLPSAWVNSLGITNALFAGPARELRQHLQVLVGEQPLVGRPVVDRLEDGLDAFPRPRTAGSPPSGRPGLGRPTASRPRR